MFVNFGKDIIDVNQVAISMINTTWFIKVSEIKTNYFLNLLTESSASPANKK